jgi:hypothetical protein
MHRSNHLYHRLRWETLRVKCVIMHLHDQWRALPPRCHEVPIHVSHGRATNNRTLHRRPWRPWPLDHFAFQKLEQWPQIS